MFVHLNMEREQVGEPVESCDIASKTLGLNLNPLEARSFARPSG